MITDAATVGRDLQRNLAKAIKSAQRKGDLPAFDIPDEIVVERPKQESMGDFASPVCMQLARLARMAPVKIAEQVVRRLPEHPAIAAVEVAHPGFINFRLATSWLTDQVSAILDAPDTYGNVDLGRGERVQVEYVSANPTGPLHMGSARNAVLGDAIASVLAAAGYDVQREYYVNDGGSQMRLFGGTLYARYAQALGHDEAVPENGYQGQYMVELGAKLAAEHGDRVTVHGVLPHQELGSLMRQSDIFVLPSFFEGLPLVLLEAMACGCRVVTTDLPGSRELFGESPPPMVRLVELPPLETVDRPFKADEPLLELRLSQALREAIADVTGGVDIDRDYVRRTTEPFGWAGIYARVEAVYGAARKLQGKN